MPPKKKVNSKSRKRRNRVYCSCSVPGCNHSTANCDYTFFSLPKHAHRRTLWLRLMQREDMIGKTATHARVCEIHFHQRYFLLTQSRKRLKKLAIPHLKLPLCLEDAAAENKSEIIKKVDASIQCDISCNDLRLVVEKSSKRIFLSDKLQSGQTFKAKDDTLAAQSNILNELHSKYSNNNFETEAREEASTLTVESNASYELSDKYLIKKEFMETDDNEYSDVSNIFKELYDKYSKEDKAKEVTEQTKLKTKKKFEVFCLNILLKNPQVYDSLKDILILPNSSTFNSLHLPVTSKIDSHPMEVLKAKVDQMSVIDRNCSLVISTTSIKENLGYNTNDDKIYGFCEIDGLQSLVPARYAVVATIRGIFENYDQLVGYALLAELQSNEKIYDWFNKLIHKLFLIGLNVRALVTDLDTYFLNVSTSIGSPYYIYGDNRIYHIFDPHHLIKLMRNSLMNYEFHFEGHIAKWNYIQQFYDKDKNKQFKIARKLTDSHMQPNNLEKLKVEYAAQVFSMSVAAGMSSYVELGAVDQQAAGTIELIARINNLYDFLNSSSLYGCTKFKNAFCGEEYQMEFINDTLKFFSSLKVIDVDNDEDKTAKVKFVQGFQRTLRSILLLFEEIKKEGQTCLITKRLTLEYLDNFFNQISAKNSISTHPTSWQLLLEFRNCFYLNILEPSAEPSCTDNLAKTLLMTGNYDRKQESEKTTTNDTDDIKLLPSDFNELYLPEKNASVYVSSFLLKKCSLQHKDCDLLNSYLEELEDSRHYRYKQYCKDGGQVLDIIPQDNFIGFVESMELKYCEYFKKGYLSWPLLKSMLEDIQDTTFAMPCECFPIKYCKRLYLCLRLYYTLKENHFAIEQSQSQQNKFILRTLLND